MAHLPTQFAETSSNVEPDTDVANAAEAHALVRRELEADPTLQQHGLETVLIGSYGRRVSIKRIKDVDVLCMLTKGTEALDPKELLRHFHDVLAAAYGRDRVTLQDRSVKVDFPEYDLSVDAVPARPLDDHWEIPDRVGGWEETNPQKLADLTTQMNEKHKLGSGIYVPTVKYVRQIRNALEIDRPSGFYFEVLAYHAFASGEVAGATRAEYLTTTLDTAANEMGKAIERGLPDPSLADKLIATRATPDQLRLAQQQLTNTAEAARSALEEADECRSALAWRALFGSGPDGTPVFPLPEFCNDDGTRKSMSALVPGERQGPRGTDRFA